MDCVEKIKNELIADLLLEVSGMYDVPFSFVSFRRKFRKYFRFSKFSGSSFCIKHNHLGVYLHVNFSELPYVLVKHLGVAANKHVYQFYVESNKELILKIIKHKLI